MNKIEELGKLRKECRISWELHEVKGADLGLKVRTLSIYKILCYYI